MTLTYNDIMTKYCMTKQQPKLHRDQDPGTTQPEGNSTHLNYKFFFFFLDTQIFPVLVVNSLCKNIFLIFFSKFPVFSLSGKMDFQIPCFPCAVATLITHSPVRRGVPFVLSREVPAYLGGTPCHVQWEHE